MNKFPARAGWQWVKQGMQLFRRQPGGLMALFFCCMFVSLVSMIVPLLGQIAPFILTPLFSIALLEGCAQVDQGKRALPNLLLSGFRKPSRNPLLAMGVLNLLLLVIALGVLYAMAGDAVMLMSRRPPQIDQSQLEGLLGAAFTSSTIYTVGWLLTCLAAPLIYWQKMNLNKALFFSVVAVFRGWKAFLTAAVTLHLLYFVGCRIVMLILGTSQLAVAGIFTLFLITIVLTHCTLYIAYRQIFGAPEAAKSESPQPLL
ncbi:MAG TPA: BPSS1780 family membrane protein [Duganella sp.]|uniref:BPSS1780 family membrane protein n=1 Tax=Duganella sp. TaxID=1904440 RepID=UPI002ED13BAE